EMRRHRDTDRELPTSYHQRLTTDHCLRLGLRCVRGLREAAGRVIVRARNERLFTSLDDLHHRVPELRKDELRKLAAVGALNFIEVVGDRVLGAGSKDLRGQRSEVREQKSKDEVDGVLTEIQYSTSES